MATIESSFAVELQDGSKLGPFLSKEEAVEAAAKAESSGSLAVKIWQGVNTVLDGAQLRVAVKGALH